MEADQAYYFKLKTKNQSSLAFELPDSVEEEGLITEIIAYKKSTIKCVFYYLETILTLGLLSLFCHWSLKFKLSLTMVKTSIDEAQFFLIYCKDGTYELVNMIPIKMKHLINENEENLIYKSFQYRLFYYYYTEEKMRFVPKIFKVNELSNNQIHQLFGQGIQSDEVYHERKTFYGENSTELPEKSLFLLILEEFFSSFFIFQVFSCVVWMLEEYETFATILLLMGLASSVENLYEIKKNIRNLRKMSFYETKVNVFRGMAENIYQSSDKSNINNYKKNISSLELVPGDILEIPENQIIPCDIILLNGATIMNESMLTGESVPISKIPLPYNNFKFNPYEENKNSILFAGTCCMEARYYSKEKFPVLGLVYRTGFSTMKGQLIRSILYPKLNTFNFFHESLKFLLAISIFSFIGLIYTLISYVSLEDDVFDITITCLDLITITIPPALPTCMSIGTGFSLIRLQKKNIFCISPGKINLAGKVNIMCFDKTGTLTEDGLDMVGIRVSSKYEMSNKIKLTSLLPICPIYDNDLVYNPGDCSPSILKETRKDRSQIMIEVMASCHSLTSINGKIIGDALDKKMFEWTGWIMEDNNENKFDELILSILKPKSISESQDFDEVKENVMRNNFPTEIGVIRRFEFSSKLQRMSVIVRNLNENKFRLHVKGSPEVIRELSKPESIPDNFHSILNDYAKCGYRVLACASRPLKYSFRHIHKLERRDIEKNLTFFGFLIMENKLKESTTEIIADLQSANIRTIMVTGDNILTAISVARQCGLVKQEFPVYFGDIGDKKVNGKSVVIWKDFELADQTLNPNTLIPLEEETKEPENNGKNHENVLKNSNGHNNNNNLLSFEMKKNSDPSEKMNKIDPLTSIKKSKMYYFSFAEKYPQITQMNFRRLPAPSKSKYVLSEIVIPKIIEEENENFQNLYEYIDDNPPPWQNLENNRFSLAISGRAFNLLIRDKNKGNDQIFKKMIEQTQIFARMKPADKTLLIQSLQGMRRSGAFVGMIGDGANDCGALKQADTGISLSETEASIAAPFTSKIQDISCVVQLLKEGRCSLTTNFQCFKYMAVYSIIQFAGCTILNGILNYFTNFEYLWVDLFLIFPLTVFMSYTKPYEKLTKFLPTSSLLSFSILASVIGQFILQIGFQVLIFLFVRERYPACEDLMEDENPADDPICYENTALFLFSNFQYMSTVIVFSIGPPFRQPVYTNIPFAITYLLLILSCSMLLIYPTDILIELFSLFDFDWNLKLYLASATFLNFFITYIYEKFCVNKLTYYWKKLKKKLKNKEKH